MRRFIKCVSPLSSLLDFFQLRPQTTIGTQVTETPTTMKGEATVQHDPPNHGLPDTAIEEAHNFIHRADSREHEQEVQAKRSGLPDSAIEAEHEFEDMVEGASGKQVCGVRFITIVTMDINDLAEIAKFAW